MRHNSKFFFSDKEKQDLKQDILSSVGKLQYRNHERRRWTYIKYVAVACFILIFSGYFFFFRSAQQSSLEFYLSRTNQETDYKSDNITVILGESQINLDSESNELSYSTSGDKLTIGKGKYLNQKTTKNNESVFNSIIVPYGKRSKVTLSDGSIVWLNSGSRLVYPVVFEENTREVYLQGEAIFDVSHKNGTSFKVLSDKQEIEVLGTVFNVSVYPNDDVQQTMLKRGSVVVTYIEEDKEVLMVPGELSSLNIHNKKIEKKSVNPDAYFSWREGEYFLNNTDLSSIAKRLSRYYNIHIEIKNKTLKNETFSGKLDLRENVQEVLKIIKHTSHFNIEYQTKDSLIIN